MGKLICKEIDLNLLDCDFVLLVYVCMNKKLDLWRKGGDNIY